MLLSGRRSHRQLDNQSLGPASPSGKERSARMAQHTRGQHHPRRRRTARHPPAPPRSNSCVAVPLLHLAGTAVLLMHSPITVASRMPGRRQAAFTCGLEVVAPDCAVGNVNETSDARPSERWKVLKLLEPRFPGLGIDADAVRVQARAVRWRPEVKTNFACHRWNRARNAPHRPARITQRDGPCALCHHCLFCHQ